MMTNRLRQIQARLQTRWLACSPREHRLLGIASLFIALLVLFLLLSWLNTERQRLERTLPLAEARLASLQAAADEHAGLRGQATPIRLSGPALHDALRVSARERGLSLDIQPGNGGWQTKGQASADAALGWLAENMRSHALRPVQLELGPDGFSATLVEATTP